MTLLDSSLLSWLALPLASLVYGFLLNRLASLFSRWAPDAQGLDRKTFHVGIFTGAAPSQLLLGFWGVVVYGSTIALLVLVAYWRGERSDLFRKLARGEGGGERRLLIILPLSATALGGLLGVLLVGQFSIVGYLVCGWGDAAGEIVGRGWGRRPYSPPFSLGRTATRSLEGSMAVLAMGFLGAWAALGLLGYSPLQSVGVGLACGLLGAGAEAVSGKGTDNLWVQLFPSIVAWWLLG